jgi:hypothetical protein
VSGMRRHSSLILRNTTLGECDGIEDPDIINLFITQR